MKRARSWDPNFIDLSPVFEPFSHLKSYFTGFHSWPQHDDLNQLNLLRTQKIRTQSGKPVCYIAQNNKKQDFANKYEPRIFLTGQIQTRANHWHDFFNALVWQIFPQAKSALNQLHYHAQLYELTEKIKDRCTLRDAATLFDESGIVVVSSRDMLIQLLRDFDWKELFWRQRKAVLSSMRFFVFGHGLYEKALDPYIGMTGKGIVFTVEDTFFAETLAKQLARVDLMLERFLLQALSSSSDLIPVPLLGYPGWIEENKNATFYENKRYFRDRAKPGQS